ncbi:MAG TPA: GMP synthase (glutamine-hydrolyzing), partial [Thermomicrobiales bacterium]|nr:GMP synthase (glutamine-hydrolyzing) [Thermomicrobiales bacterium]
MPNTHDADPAYDAVVVVDFGSQYSQLIARRVRECGVYCEIAPHDATWERVAPLRPKGIILSGGPASVYDEGAPRLPAWVVDSGLPVLGICYGLHLLAQAYGGEVAPARRKEYGPATIDVAAEPSSLFAGLPD